MKSSLLLGIVSLALCSAGQAAERYTPATFLDGKMVQPAIGFSGISFSVPAGYYRYTPLKKGTPSEENFQWAWSMSTDCDQTPGVTSLEHIPFAKIGFGITVAITRVARPVPSVRDRLAYKAEVESAAHGFRFAQGKVEFRDTREIGGRMVARVTRELPESSRYNAVYIVLVPPRYQLLINGVSASRDREALMADMEAMIASIAFKAPKK